MRFHRILLLSAVSFALVVSPTGAATPEEYINSAFPYLAGEGGAPQLPMGEITSADRPGVRYFKTQQPGGGTAHLYAHGPFAYADGSKVTSVNTDLIATSAGWRAASVPFDVQLPRDLADGIVWRDAGIGESVRIYPQNINRSVGRIYSGSTDTVIYDEVWNRSYMTVAITPHGIKDHIILTDKNGVPNQFRFRVERPAGARTATTGAGGVQVVSASGAVLAELPAPAARDRDHQEFKIWYEVESHSGFDTIVLRYDTSPVTAEGTTITYEAPFDLDPAIYSGALVHGINAFRDSSQNAYTFSEFIGGNLRSSLLKVPTYDAGRFALWRITPPGAGSRWYSFGARVEGRVGVTQKYSLTDGAGVRYTFGPAAEAGTYFAQDVSFTPQGDTISRIEATSLSTPLFDYYGQLTNPVVIYEDLVDPQLTDLRPNNTTVSASQVTLHVGMADAQSGCGTVTVTLHGPVAPIGTRAGDGCSLAPSFPLRTEGPHRIEVLLTDRSGRQTTASSSFTFDSPIDPPQPPVNDGDDPAVDQEWSKQTTAFSATWKAASGAAGYQLCFTASAPCATDDRWTGFDTQSGKVGGYAFQHGQTVYACVRSITTEGVRTTATCSNGVRVDVIAPTPPSGVRDGDIEGVDIDRTASTFESAANWGASFDDAGLAQYETCLVEPGNGCAAEDEWVADGVDPLTRIARRDDILDVGASVAYCVRAADLADNISAAACSDGQRVIPSDIEVADNLAARTQFNLTGGETYVRMLLTSPPGGAAALNEQLGFVMTDAEASKLLPMLNTVDVQSAEAETYGMSHPASYAGTFVHPQRPGHIIVGFTKDLKAHERRLVRQIIKNAKSRPKVHFRLRKFSLNRMSFVQDTVIDAVPSYQRQGIRIEMIDADVRRNRVVVGIKGSAKSVARGEQALRKAHGDIIAVRRIATMKGMSATSHSEKRPRVYVLRESALFWTGHAMPGSLMGYSFLSPQNAYGTCTMGFSAVIGVQVRGLIAAHCSNPCPIDPGNGQDTPCGGPYDQYDYKIGRRFESGKHSGQPSAADPDSPPRFKNHLGTMVSKPRDEDIGLIQFADAKFASNDIFTRSRRGKPGFRGVTALRSPILGSRVCKSSRSEGALVRQGYSCGRVSAAGRWMRGAGRYNVAQIRTCGTDSGGPVFWIDPSRENVSQAVGITVANSSSSDFLQTGLGTHEYTKTSVRGERLTCRDNLVYNQVEPFLRSVGGRLL